jgi:SM-20-related protein
VRLPHLRIHEFLDPAEADALLHWAIANEAAFQPTLLAYADEKNAVFRKSLSTRDLGPHKPVLKNAMVRQLDRILSGLGMKSFRYKTELELVAHNDGARFDRHTDNGLRKGQRRIDRRVSAVYYFHRAPKAFSGGALRLHALGAGGHEDIAPDHNMLLAFPSFAPHEVCEVHCPSQDFADSRFAVNIWLHFDPES